MTKRILHTLMTLLAIASLWGCSKPEGTDLELDLEVLIVKNEKDPMGRYITWPLGSDINVVEPTLIYEIKGFTTYKKGFWYIIPVRVQIENGKKSYSLYKWDNHILQELKSLDGILKQ